MEPFTKDIAECFETPAIDVIARVDQTSPARDAAPPDELAQLRFFEGRPGAHHLRCITALRTDNRTVFPA
ncbi:hypothetical protein WL96_15935 [Burkholderia vietnamiensis]|nr:hypothetical protein WL96_15935 [Burkholderia vietnamiensis]CAG9203080.1 conserved hypothetical protein [Burkholderia vietnamiensis]